MSLAQPPLIVQLVLGCTNAILQPEDSYPDDVIEVETPNEMFEELNQVRPGHIAVMGFAATWCPLCNDFDPTYQQIAEAYKGSHLFLHTWNYDSKGFQRFFEENPGWTDKWPASCVQKGFPTGVPEFAAIEMDEDGIKTYHHIDHKTLAHVNPRTEEFRRLNGSDDNELTQVVKDEHD